PVEASVEDRMEGSRALRVLGAGEDVIELVRVLARYMAESQARKRAGNDGEVVVRPNTPGGSSIGHRRKTRTYMSTVFATRSKSAVGTCARMTAFLSGSSRSGAGTTLKLAAACFSNLRRVWWRRRNGSRVRASGRSAGRT